jgi:hypothetical protein
MKHCSKIDMGLTSIITVVGRLRQRDCEFKASLDYIVRPCLERRKKFYSM